MACTDFDVLKKVKLHKKLNKTKSLIKSENKEKINGE